MEDLRDVIPESAVESFPRAAADATTGET